MSQDQLLHSDTILEMDQGFGPGYAEFQKGKVTRNDLLQTGPYRFKEKRVKDTDSPPWAHVWYKEKEDGSLYVYKAYYDSSG